MTVCTSHSGKDMYSVCMIVIVIKMCRCHLGSKATHKHITSWSL